LSAWLSGNGRENELPMAQDPLYYCYLLFVTSKQQGKKYDVKLFIFNFKGRSEYNKVKEFILNTQNISLNISCLRLLKNTTNLLM